MVTHTQAGRAACETRPGPSGPRLQGDEGRPETQILPQVRPETFTRLQRPWNVVVLDDPVNLMSYVVYVFQKLFGFSLEKAERKMLEVHNEGRSVVASDDRERAEFYVARLHAYGLQATLELSEA